MLTLSKILQYQFYIKHTYLSLSINKVIESKKKNIVYFLNDLDYFRNKMKVEILQ
jgi:hypothetical protein